MKIAKLSFCAIMAIISGPSWAAHVEQPATQRFPVLAWMGPPPAEANVQRYRELAECGFTDSFSGFANASDMARALDAGKEAGVKLLLSCPELRSDPQATAKRFKAHPALGGYFLQDEPAAASFAELAAWARQIEAADPDHLVYINLLPDYADSQQLGTATYQQYIDRFVKEVPVPILSFDYYPIVDHSVRGSWYSNLEMVAAASRASGKSFRAFALSQPHYSYPTPTLAHLREQVYSNLAYGTQGIQYFTYWSATSLSPQAPIDSSGKRTPIYDLVRQVNGEIRALSPVFVRSKVQWVRHTGESIPAGTHRFEPEHPIESLVTKGNGAVVSRLTNGSGQFLLIVNRDINAPMSVSLRFSKGATVRQIQKDGIERTVAGEALRATVDPGDALLLTW